jgi:hypothetical protein
MQYEEFRKKSNLSPKKIIKESSIHDFSNNIYFCSLLKKIDKKQDFIIYELYKQNKKIEWIIYFNLTIFFSLIIIYFTWIFYFS